MVNATPFYRLDTFTIRKGRLLGAALHDPASWSDAVRQPYVAADLRTSADHDASQDRGSGIDDDIILDDGVAGDAFDGIAVLVEREALGT